MPSRRGTTGVTVPPRRFRRHTPTVTDRSSSRPQPPARPDDSSPDGSFTPLVSTGLPVESARDDIVAAVAGARRPGTTPGHGSLVLRAEPGAGKSSLVPLFVAQALGPEQPSLILTEPRRLAARATAARLAELLGEPVGERVGLTIRGERTVSAHTRIEVVTEAVLVNRLHADPELGGVGAVVFDEFHERSSSVDLALGMALEVRNTLRPDLAIVVMSATLDVDRVAALLARPLEPTGRPTGGAGAPILDLPGRTFEITTEHRARPAPRQWTAAVASAIESAAGRVSGDVLVFVPGRREIDDVIAEIGRRSALSGLEVLGLHGGTPVDRQRDIIGGGRQRRVIVATSVAETSLTVPGVEAVVDGGRARRPVFDPSSGLGRLETTSVTRFAADQRRGRAGRVGPGLCIRLWSSDDHRHLDETVAPALVGGDPLPVGFELARWGDPWADSLPLLDPPGRSRLDAAQSILSMLGLVDPGGRLSERGSQAARLGLHPRLAALVMTATDTGRSGLGLRAASLLDDDRRPSHADLADELERRWSELDRPARRLGRRLGIAAAADRSDLIHLGPLLAAAWPDRVAMARPDRPGRFLLAIGREVDLGADTPLAASEFVIVAEADGAARAARVRRAVAITRADVLDAAGDRVEWSDRVEWDQRDDTLRAERQQRLGRLVLHRLPLNDPPADAVSAGLRAGLRRSGLGLLDWGSRGVSVRARLAWLHQEDPAGWPDLGDDALIDRLDDWLDLSRCRSVKDLRRIAATDALLGLLGWEQRRHFDELAPAELEPPRGRTRPIDYASGRPVWSVRLQNVFGLDDHPLVGPHRVPLTIELLSPAGRPAQVTTDLPGFWRGSYAAVRADLRGRYPKHAWPEDPLSLR